MKYSILFAVEKYFRWNGHYVFIYDDAMKFSRQNKKELDENQVPFLSYNLLQNPQKIKK